RRWIDVGPPDAGSPDAGPSALGPVDLTPARAHTGVRVPFVLPDGTVLDWVLTRRGWCRRVR
ncbi:MAG: hypothetical protein WD225_11770, partial [Ilumatobacteraceae bacterium]